MDSDNYKILAVDDNPKNLKVLAALLSAHNYQVDYAFSGMEALKFAEAEEYDLVLLDIMMPVMDGFETCLKIKENEKNKELPVIFLTARSETESITQAFNVGGYDYITKPFRGDELLARVKTHVTLKRLREAQKEINKWLELQVRERTEELVIANRQLEKANLELETLDRAKNEFLRMINHEIRTPLNAILGFTGILKNTPISSELIEPVQYLDIASLRLEKFLMVVLQITELLTQGKRVRMEPVVVSEVISTVKMKMKEQFSSKNIMLGLSAGLYDLRLFGNIKLLAICFESILENAIKYSDQNGTITIQGEQKENKVIIEIIDTGSGFSQAAMSTLFRFFAIGEQHVDQNAGLGLALSKLVMEAHHGDIQINNNPDKGATVRLIFNGT